jgi:hypothetical protein
MTQDEMIESFKSAPKGSRHQRMLWAAHKIARLTGVTEGGAYQMLLVALSRPRDSRRMNTLTRSVSRDDNKATARTI